MDIIVLPAANTSFTDALLEKQEKGEVRLVTLKEMYGKK